MAGLESRGPRDHDLLMSIALPPPDQQAREHLLLHFARNGAPAPVLVLERGEGSHVFDTDGNAYIDGLSALFCCQLGHAYGEEMAQAAATQLQTMSFATVWGSAHPTAIELAARLAELMPGDLDRVFFTNGGSESVEAAWKLARQFHVLNGQPERTKVIARDVAYHGVTLGAMAISGVQRYAAPFGKPALDVFHVSNTNAFRTPEQDDPAALCARLLGEIEDVIAREGGETIGMLIAEPVQNAGGCLTPPPGYWQGLRDICDREGILLVSDEVICGFGRLGHWLGVEREGVVPDMATTAKGITSAYAPMGAVLVGDKVADAFSADATRTLLHGITFAGHPLCAAIALKNLEIFEREDVLGHVRATEPHLQRRLEALKDLPIVGDVRGAGFFWALELVKGDDGRLDADERERLLRGYLPGRLMEAGVITRADDRGEAVLHLAPPLVADAATLDTLVDRVGEVLTDAAGVLA